MNNLLYQTSYKTLHPHKPGIVESPDIRFRINFKRVRDIKLNWHFINFVSIVSSLLVTLRHSLRHSLHYCPRLYYCNCRGCSQHFQPTVPSATARERKPATARTDSESTVSGFGDVATALNRLCLPGFVLCRKA